MSTQFNSLIQGTEPWVLSLVALAAASVVLYSTRRSSPNEPPLVPYLIPWVGHTIPMLTNSKRFLSEAKNKYGEMFTIVFFGRKFIVVAGKSLATEVFKAGEDSLSFSAASAEIIPAQRLFALSYSDKFVPNLGDAPVPHAIRKNLKPHQIVNLQSPIMEGTQTAIDNEIGPNGARWDNPLDRLQRVVATISCLCFAGDEIGRNETLISTLAEFTGKLTMAGLVSSNLPIWLGDIIVKRMFSLRKEMDVIHELAKPVIDRRLLEQEQQPDWEPPHDMLQWMQEAPRSNGQDRETSDTALMLAMVGLVSIHTTSTFCLFAFHELSAYPEVAEILRAKISEAIAGADGVLTPELADKIPELDSFTRETLRLNTEALGMRHMAKHDYTFSNGMVAKEGTVLLVSAYGMHCDPEIQPSDTNKNLDQFDAFRFAKLPSKKAYHASSSFLTFGEGPHTCPGRFFAIQEIKYLLASILMRYNIKTTSKGRAPNRYMFGMIAVPPSNPIIFEPIEKKQSI